MMSEQEKIESQWELVKERFQLAEELWKGLDLTEIESALLISNQIDELIMLLGNIGIEVREGCRKALIQQRSHQRAASEEEQWLQSLMDRAQVKSS